MNILGIDYGHKRVGLAYADTEIGVAVPIPAAVEPDFDARLNHIAVEIQQRRIQKIVIGYPFNMDGTVGFKAKEVDEYIKILEERFNLPIERADERLSSFQAEQDRVAMKFKSKKTVAGRQKYRRSGDIDSRAISLVLQEYLDSHNGRF